MCPTHHRVCRPALELAGLSGEKWKRCGSRSRFRLSKNIKIKVKITIAIKYMVGSGTALRTEREWRRDRRKDWRERKAVSTPILQYSYPAAVERLEADRTDARGLAGAQRAHLRARCTCGRGGIEMNLSDFVILFLRVVSWCAQLLLRRGCFQKETPHHTDNCHGQQHKLSCTRCH